MDAPDAPDILLPGSEEPVEKFVRTFEKDAAALKGGQVVADDLPVPTPPPGARRHMLVPPPIATRPPVTPEPPKPPAPVTPPVVRAPAMPPPLPVMRTLPEVERPAPRPIEALVPPPPPPPPPEPVLIAPRASQAKVPPAGALQTYTNDFNDRLQTTHASTATVLAAEQDAKQGAPVLDEPQKKIPLNTILFTVAGGLLLLLGAGGAYFAYVKLTTVPPVVVPIVTAIAPITVEDQVKLSGTGATLMQAFAEAAQTTLAVGTIRQLYTDASLSTTSPESVFAELRSGAPDVLARNVKPQGTMLGVVNVSGSQTPFLILAVTSYADTFSGMLAWEPRVRQDLALLYPPYPDATSAAVSTTTAPSTTLITSGAKLLPVKSGATTPPAQAVVLPTFVDSVVSNHDVRIYRDANRHTILLYGYWNPSTLVIARNEAAFTEILGRLANARP